MIVSLRDKLSKLCRTPPDRHPPRRAKLGFYGYRYRKARSRWVTVTRTAIATVVAIAAVAAASGHLGR
jgi:hypothetical protein